MPLKDSDTIENQIKHGEHLTLVDKMRASVLPNASFNEAGQPNSPKEEFLTRQAAMRKQEADAEAKNK